MGNCQAIDSASLVIQQPNGKAERLYWPVSAGEVMKTNPGHYVALLISSALCPSQDNEKCHDKNKDNPINNNPVRITRIKLLKPTDTLLLGHVYRLITTQEVMKGLLAKKQAKMQKGMVDSTHKLDWVKGKASFETDKAARRSETEDKQAIKAERERERARTGASSANSSGSITAKSRTWQPSLLSISESAS
ncbi:hypothetical protein QN277_006736 [Acacia crassicarpa]|uniref:Uncharacterized protein n=1 Tax=Acacia crassicarpa TaxID=499986 RepID=A0AAE1JPZ3_9FABA|nr:hypothetical protein QN277_006736 [Acacia crassicarpa]